MLQALPHLFVGARLVLTIFMYRRALEQRVMHVCWLDETYQPIALDAIDVVDYTVIFFLCLVSFFDD